MLDIGIIRIRRMFGENVVIDRPTLEDIMLYYTRRNQNA